MEPIRVGIIGQGRSGRDIHGAHLARDTRYRIVAVVDPLPERRERAIAEYGCEAHAEHRALLARDDLDLVVVAAPSKYHVPYTLEALQAGHNVLCEKPFASRVADVDRMIAASREAGKLLAVFQQSRFAPYFLKVQEVIRSGVLGEIVQVSISFSGFSRRYDWQTLRSEMGGNLLNTGPHPLDQALQLFGADAMPDVTCLMRHTTSCGDADDHVVLILSGQDHPIIHLEISSCCKYPASMYTVYGARGGLCGSAERLEWQWYDPQTAPEVQLVTTPLCKEDGTPAYCSDRLDWQRDEWSMPEGADLFGTMCEAFYSMLHRTLTQGAPLEITPQQVRRQIAVIEECQRQNPHLYPQDMASAPALGVDSGYP